LESTGAAALSRRAAAGLFGLHGLGLVGIWRLAHWPVWAAAGLAAAVAAAAWFGRKRGSAVLAPLGWLYGLALLRLGWVYGLRREAPPELNYEWTLAVCAAWSGLIALNAARRLRWAPVLAGVAAAVVLAAQLVRLRPAGVTGSDPFAYVQMAVDLAERGTARHGFPLAVLAEGLGLPTLPATHVGYVLPNAEGLAPTVWPPGYSVLLAAAYKVGGERALLTFNAWLALGGAAVTAVLAAWLTPRPWRGWAAAVGGAAAFCLATAPEQFTRMVVPLADGAAQLLTALALLPAVWLVREGRHHEGHDPMRSRTPGDTKNRVGTKKIVLMGVAAGLMLAAAYSARYTQVLAAGGIAAGAMLGLRTRRQRLAFVGAAGAAALAGALPDVLYRVRLYGTPWRFGTGELGLFSLGALPEALGRLGAEVMTGAEFGWLWPLTLLGAAHAWRHARPALLVALAAYAPVLIFHLWYPFLRLRDLLSLYPLLAALTALGASALARAAWRATEDQRRAVGRAGVVGVVLCLGAVRLGPLVTHGPLVFTFGYLLPEQHADLQRLVELTEPNAVVASSLNSGAVELYGRRLAVRPGRALQPGAAWTEAEWLRFVEGLRAEGRPLYLLMDSPEMAAPLDAVRVRYPVEGVAEMDVPVFALGGGSTNLTVDLYRIVFP
jgi:hypothetical protein